jgi:hypothetical protein
MVYVNVYKYARIVEQVVGELHIVPTAKPNPWFSRDINSPNDLQWGGYVGDFSAHKQALVFGINLEFTGAWKWCIPKLRETYPFFHSCFASIKTSNGIEWAYQGNV